MKTIITSIDRQKPSAASLARAGEVLGNGGVIAFPTDTVYGLAASVFDREAQKKIYHLKGRSFRKPLIIMPPDIRSLEGIVEIHPDARALMKHFWPGPLTIILPTTPLGKMIMGGRADAGVRMPDDPVVLGLLKTCGFPIATTSANPSGAPSAKSGAAVRRHFEGSADMILDAGRCPIGTASTVIDMIRFPYVVVREGCLPSKKLLQFL